MQSEYQLSNASGKDRNEIVALLKEENLPTGDLPLALNYFIIATDNNDQLIGVIGLENYGKYGLLRSMAVNSNFRNQGIASMLVYTLETRAKEMGIQAVFLLTETAAGYFKRKGYTNISRDEVPTEIKTSTEYSNVCPVSADVMIKQIILSS